jgi:hypothetical protein
MESEDLKLKPYDRLQAILSEKDNGKLTKNASEKLDELFGSKDKETSFFDKVRDFFLKIDKKIFKSSSRMFNTTFYKRKR